MKQDRRARLNRSFRKPGRLRSAFTLAELLVCVAIMGVLVGLVLSAVQAARAASARLACADRMRQLGIALHARHDAHSVLPPACAHPSAHDHDLYGPAQHPYQLLNWGARLLPYLDQQALFAAIEERYRADPTRSSRDGWASVTNVPLAVFQCPSSPPHPRPHGTSNYLGVAGTTSSRSDGLLYMDSSVRFADVADGLSNTLLVGERPAIAGFAGGRWHGGWGPWGAGDAYLGVRETVIPNNDCPESPYPFQRGDRTNRCSAYHFWSFHPGGANFLFADGSVRFLPYSADSVLPALATRAGGEPVGS